MVSSFLLLCKFLLGLHFTILVYGFTVQVSIRITFCCVCWGFLFLVPGMQSRPAVPVEVCDLRFLAGRYLRTFHPTKY